MKSPLELCALAERCKRSAVSSEVIEMCDAALEVASHVGKLERDLSEARAAVPGLRRPIMAAVEQAVVGEQTPTGQPAQETMTRPAVQPDPVAGSVPAGPKETRAEYMKRWRRGEAIKKRLATRQTKEGTPDGR